MGLPEQKLFIGGSYQNATSGETFDTINPATGQVITSVQHAGPSDVDRAVDFYAEKAGFNLDGDHRAGETFRVVQLTPPGSACSIALGIGISPVAPGTYQGLHLVVEDIEKTIAELSEKGVEIGEPFHFG